MPKVTVEYLREYVQGAILDSELFVRMLQSEDGFVEVSQAELDSMQERKAKHDADAERLHRAAELNNEGIEHEKNGQIELAIAAYEKNSTADCYPTLHPFNRLMILYRKRKERDKEIETINRAISIFGQLAPRYEKDVARFSERLAKLQAARL